MSEVKIEKGAVRLGGIIWQYKRRSGQVYCVGYVLDNGEQVEKHAYKYEGVL